MPSNHTKNYNLNQWAKSDRVKMEDFNADNAKIDAAIKALDTKTNTKTDKTAHTALQGVVAEVSARAGSEVLASITLTEAKSSVDLDLTGVNWSNYSTLLICIVPVNPGNTNFVYTPPFPKQITPLRLNDPSVTVLFPLRSADTPLNGLLIYDASNPLCLMNSQTFGSLTKCNFKAISGDLQPGTKIWAVGIH